MLHGFISTVRIRILNLILNLTGSRCNESKIDVMWELWLKPVNSLAAAFFSNCRWFNDVLLREVKRELQWSS